MVYYWWAHWDTHWLSSGFWTHLRAALLWAQTSCGDYLIFHHWCYCILYRQPSNLAFPNNWVYFILLLFCIATRYSLVLWSSTSTFFGIRRHLFFFPHSFILLCIDHFLFLCSKSLYGFWCHHIMCLYNYKQNYHGRNYMAAFTGDCFIIQVAVYENLLTTIQTYRFSSAKAIQRYGDWPSFKIFYRSPELFTDNPSCYRPRSVKDNVEKYLNHP